MGCKKVKSKSLEIGDTVHIISNIAIYKVSYEIDFETIKKEVMEECGVFFGDMSRPYNYEYFSIFSYHPYFEPVRKITGKLSLIKLPYVSNIEEFSFEVEPDIIKKPLDKFKVQLVKDYIYQRFRKKIQTGSGNKRKIFYVKLHHTPDRSFTIFEKRIFKTGEYVYDWDYEDGNCSHLKNIKNHILYRVDHSGFWYSREMLLADTDVDMLVFLGVNKREAINMARKDWKKDHKNSGFCLA